MKSESFTALEASSTVLRGNLTLGHQPSPAISISCQGSRCPSRSQKNQVWMQCLNFLWEVVIMSCLLAEGISDLVQRMSHPTLISFAFLQCVWSLLRTYNIAVHLSMRKRPCQHGDQKFPSTHGPHCHSSDSHFTLGWTENSKVVAASTPVTHFCVVLTFVFRDWRAVFLFLWALLWMWVVQRNVEV